MASLIEKLLKAQAELKAPKGNFNSFGKYKYRSAEDILEAVKPINAKHGLLLTLSDEPVLIGNMTTITNKDGSSETRERVYIKATASITDGETTHSVTAYAREPIEKRGMDDSQITGTASSYARKYALNGLYLIDDTKDADTDEYQKQTQKDTFKPITQKQVGMLQIKAKEFANLRNSTEKEVYKALNIKEITKLSTDYASKSIKTLEGWIKKASEADDDTKAKAQTKKA